MRAAVVAIICLSAIVAKAQVVNKNFGSEARLLKKTLLEQHVQPRIIDDSYSAWVYNHIIDDLDPDRIYFTQADLKILSPFTNKIDDELNGSAWAFVPQLTQLYKKSLERYQQGINEIGQQATDFSKVMYFEDDSLWSVDGTDLKKYWEQTFRYNTLERLLDLQQKFQNKPEKEFLDQNEKPARQQVLKLMLRDADRVVHHSIGLDGYVASRFFKSMAAAFDPHTTFFSSQEVQNFMSSLSTQGYYFGITLGENDRGEVSITQLMPGGPAWKSGEIHTGDVLEMVRWEGQESVDLWGIDLNEVNDMLEETNHSVLEITLRKSDGTIKTIKLRKEKIESEQGMVKSFILAGSHKIGYISLPDFYTDWGDEDGSKCANDVAREIMKLKKENIEGLIFDVRFNGGGSMLEAVAMAGIFIDAGPVGVIKNKAGELKTVKDMNRGTIYDGPLVLMVNSMSASASEFLAAALQDYNRAIIVGGDTYGKATAQTFIPTDPKAVAASAKPQLNGGKPNGFSFASITIEKLYRITGKTAQQTGVVPDIMLPDALQDLPIREKHLPLAFPPDSIQKKMYYQPLPKLSLNALREKSRQRVDMQPKFSALKKYSEQIAELHVESEPISLRWQDFKKQYAEDLSIVDGVEASSSAATSSYKALKLQAEEQRMQIDSYVNEFNRVWIKNLEEDIFLNEAFLIICDFIPYVTKK